MGGGALGGHIFHWRAAPLAHVEPPLLPIISHLYSNLGPILPRFRNVADAHGVSRGKSSLIVDLKAKLPHIKVFRFSKFQRPFRWLLGLEAYDTQTHA